MKTKELGKITFAQFGTIKDYPFLAGLTLNFKLGSGSMIGCGGKYTINVHKDYKWASPKELMDKYIDSFDFLIKVLESAKVNYVSELVGKPVEVEIEDNTFKGFRILEEVL